MPYRLGYFPLQEYFQMFLNPYICIAFREIDYDVAISTIDLITIAV